MRGHGRIRSMSSHQTAVPSLNGSLHNVLQGLPLASIGIWNCHHSLLAPMFSPATLALNSWTLALNVRNVGTLSSLR